MLSASSSAPRIGMTQQLLHVLLPFDKRAGVHQAVASPAGKQSLMAQGMQLPLTCMACSTLQAHAGDQVNARSVSTEATQGWRPDATTRH